jgi:hypothetical protein
MARLQFVLRLVVALTVLPLLFAAGAHTLPIDSFDSGDPFVLENTDQGVTLTQPADVLGGSREVATLDFVEFDPATGMKLTVTPTRNNGHLAVVYEAGGVDLTSDGADRFQVTIDPGQGFGPDTTYMEVVVFIDGWPFRISGTPADGVFEILYGTEASRVTDADEISLVLLTNNSFQEGEHLTLTDFRTVPEPSTALLLAFGLAGLATGRRRFSA